MSACVGGGSGWGGGVKIILNYTFVTWNAFCLLCVSCSRLINSVNLTFLLLIIHKTSTILYLFLSFFLNLCLSPFNSFLHSLGCWHFRVFIRVYWCICTCQIQLPHVSFSLGIYNLTAHIGGHSLILANDDKTIRVERNTLFSFLCTPAAFIYINVSTVSEKRGKKFVLYNLDTLIGLG